MGEVTIHTVSTHDGTWLPVILEELFSWGHCVLTGHDVPTGKWTLSV